MQKSNLLLKAQNIHLVGVGGIGLSRLAYYFLAAKKNVSGSDLNKNEITDDLQKKGIRFFQGHSAENIPVGTDLLIYNQAVSEQNSERQFAREHNILEMSHFEVLGEISRNHHTIAVAGTNGKSTTTAMIGLILEAAGLDPTVFIGSKVRQWGGNLRIGKGKYFVIEADELGRQFLHLRPQTVVLTNIEMDHADYYKDQDDYKSAFVELLKLLPKDGTVIYNINDPISGAVGDSSLCLNKKNYGKGRASFKLLSREIKEQKQRFDVEIDDGVTKFELAVPGEYNVFNSLAAIACARGLGVDLKIAAAALLKYTGIWRRFEILGNLGKTLIISDYGHHPTPVLVTMAGAREFYKGKRILLVFQPHQKRRTKVLFESFVESLVGARPDCLIVSEIYDVAGREDRDEKISSLDLLKTIGGRLPKVIYSPDLEQTELKVRELASDYDVVIIMGAGDIYKVAEKLVS